MSGYLSDWLYAEQHAQQALEYQREIGCTKQEDCPATEHMAGCVGHRLQMIRENPPGTFAFEKLYRDIGLLDEED